MGKGSPHTRILDVACFLVLTIKTECDCSSVPYQSRSLAVIWPVKNLHLSSFFLLHESYDASLL
jgi:hypothetical protein